ncbi:MAG TPA: hypothetical protein PLT09_01255 [Deltaproteobacteria bacterium]|nr:hypothetical protein [Deltaproteobacteria bacterium]HPR55547.1 hypothetical protein [Deltaproteobacteria bacterium]HXK46038.1 hypothetical protein [Deltaproteobacteria bacterium]
MRIPAGLCLVALFGLFLLASGCSKEEEPVSVQAPSPASEQPAAEKPQPSVKGSEMDKALAVHKEFATSFSGTLVKGDTVEAVQERMALADRTRLNSMMLRSELKDTDAAEFLVRFTDLLQSYLDLGSRHIATLEEVNRLLARGKEMQDRIAKMPDKEKDQATKEFNAVVDEHNSLVKGALTQEQKELETLKNELLELK